MIVVVNFNEGLYSGSFGRLLFAHFLRHFKWIARNSSDKSMTEWLVCGTIVVILHYHCLFACITPA